MDNEKNVSDEEMEPLRRKESISRHSISSIDSTSTASHSLAFLDALNSRRNGQTGHGRKSRDIDDGRYRDDELDMEDGDFLPENKESGKKFRRALWIVGLICLAGWVLTFIFFWVQGNGEEEEEETLGIDSADSQKPISKTFGKKITIEQILSGEWSPRSHSISWIPGPNGEDGLLLERDGSSGGAYLRVEDIRDRGEGDNKGNSTRILMQDSGFRIDGNMEHPSEVWPSPDMKKVLAMTSQEKNWRHSFTGIYWLFDVESQAVEPLDPDQPKGRIQLASWSPESDAVVFTRDNNMFIRSLQRDNIQQITSDGGVDLFYGIPDWVYEEEVFSSNSATWWAKDGKHIAFLQTDESAVPEYPVQYFLSRPSGEEPPPDEENYPDIRQIKYPKAGAPNPTVNLQFYDVEKGETFSVQEVAEAFPDDDRLIIDVVWTSSDKVLVRETNRESDIVKTILIDMKSRTGTVARSENIAELDGGWVEPGHTIYHVPADPAQGRQHDGYVDLVINDGYNHLAYFPNLNSTEPVMLTSGDWEVVGGPHTVDTETGLVYFISTKQHPTQRHVYSVKLDGSDMQALTNTEGAGYYDASFSAGAGYALLSYRGPKIPSQKVISTPSNGDEFEAIIEDNKALADKAKKYAVPTEIYDAVTIDGFTLPVVERRPPYFNPSKKYPVLFFLYGGPGSQTVDRKFGVDFQSYVASTLGYIVVTVDGRGTGFNGRESRSIIRDNIGYYEARDQIETAKIWGNKKYVDSKRMAIWGWSYGGYMTLKTLEQDAGETFQYGIAVAPVTNWSFYDSIYTERYMHTPQHNPAGYENASISDMAALGSNIRFLFMHGVADDNVHMQNSLELIDNLDLAGIDNYDVHFFPDSDHSIYFHNARQMVYDRLSNWLVNAFNGEWHKTQNPVSNESIWKRVVRSFSRS